MGMKKVFSNLDKTLLFMIIAFFIFGLVMVLSASSMESYMRYGYGPYHYFYRQALFIGIGFLIFLIIIHIPTKVYRGFTYLLIIGIILILGALNVYGHVAKSAQSWFKVGGLSIQPSEFAKVIIILFLAAYYEKKKEDLDNFNILIRPLILVIIIFGLVATQPDLGTALIIGGITFLIFMSLPVPRKLSRKISLSIVGITLVGICALLVGSKYFLKSYQLERFNFKDPCLRYQDDSGYQLCNSFIAFKNGGVTGQGIGKSTQKYLYLPESYTDFIFPIIVEEWGAIAGIIIVFCYLFIIYRLYKIARRAVNLQGSILAYGVCAYLFLHVSINLIGVMGIGPLTGVPLPFLSYGGSYVISLFVSLGIAERVSVESAYHKERENKKKAKKRKSGN